MATSSRTEAKRWEEAVKAMASKADLGGESLRELQQLPVGEANPVGLLAAHLLAEGQRFVV